ncbi:2-phospho-L-lactate transferase [Desertihabitans brevis]|uniref:2-phospho-L-lactate transferase n=1 Tax=Desertihabitans brevis TaxID=2268447 RepID=A0A367YXX6_9ACTN|nr:2-phospho-L-lactate transferase [Desertihabitans brevis]RCK70746.1 2-phospho-L-lactate transferase [Desertihabitans brevis]
MQIVVLAGGVGGSRFVRGVLAAYPGAQVTVVGNTADDITLHGLRICPDLDTMTYALGGAIDPERGWGLADEGWRVMEELRAHAAEPTWFNLGDRDIATHLIRTQMLAAGYPLSDVTRALTQRWLGADSPVTLLPMSDDRVETHVVIADDDAPGGRRAVHFQEFWVRMHAEPPVLEVVQVGIEEARPAPGVLEALAGADLVLVAPSNPVVSIGPVLATPGVRDAVRATPAPVVGFSGILSGRPVLGMADKLLPAIGVEVDAAAVGLHYGSRRAGGVLDRWVVDSDDAAALARLRDGGLEALAHPLLMTDPDTTAAFIRAGVSPDPDDGRALAS